MRDTHAVPLLINCHGDSGHRYNVQSSQNWPQASSWEHALNRQYWLIVCLLVSRFWIIDFVSRPRHRLIHQRWYDTVCIVNDICFWWLGMECIVSVPCFWWHCIPAVLPCTVVFSEDGLRLVTWLDCCDGHICSTCECDVIATGWNCPECYVGVIGSNLSVSFTSQDKLLLTVTHACGAWGEQWDFSV